MKIYSWSEWGARARPSNLSPQTVKSDGVVFLHHSVRRARPNMSAGEERAYMRDFEAQHMSQGWKALGYSFVVFPSGRVYRGRGFNNVPAAQVGHNTGNGAICFVGDFRYDKTTWRARLSAIRLARQFPGRYLSWHGAVNATECPGPHVRSVAPRIAQLAGKKIRYA